ncbi:MAG: VOC family protein [Gemmatimonadaceae bacterium]|jgi:catechol 2,3-dioxygenase|nr:VOC family protein [Gemmatimonadaceae bacterium]
MSLSLLPDATSLGAVTLRVADLSRSIAWYTEVLGARVLSQHDAHHAVAATATLGAHGDDTPLLQLVERPGARPAPSRGRLGLYHVAWLLPDRAALGRFLAHVAQRGERVGSADHLVSEALYLQDPDNLGVEVYRDRPRAEWTVEQGRVAMASLPLDARGLLRDAAGAPYTGLPAGTRIGHVHLHVGDLTESTRFYRDVLGLSVTQDGYPGAVFLSAGGYHHHLGTNEWAGPGAVPATEDDAALLQWTVEVPHAEALDALRARARAAGVAVAAVAGEGGDALMLADPWGTHVTAHAARR